MRVLWVGDSPTVSTGFARCTRACCAELKASGHDVWVLGINYNGDPHRYPYDIFPCRKGDNMGMARLPELIDALRPQVVVILQDPWNIDPYFANIEENGRLKPTPPIVGWLAVDAKNHPNSKELNQLRHIITWTAFAINELRAGGYTGTSSIIPLGTNLDVFRPMDRAECRAAVLPAELKDAFIVGVVGRNQPRKRIDLAIDYFAQFVKDFGVNDAYLYLHVAPTGERGCDIRNVAAYYGEELVGKILFSAPRAGVADADLAQLYNCFDAYLTTTQGEGWGLPTNEAMACGVPCIVPDWSALGEWTGDAAIKIPCTSTALTAPLDFFPYTIGGVPSKHDTVRALWQLYGYKPVRQEFAQRGLQLVQDPRLQWSMVARAMRRELEGIVSDENRRATEAFEQKEAPESVSA